MQNPVPHGSESLKCPLWRKPMSEVCHTCPLWTQLRGLNPNTGQEIDEWNCALALTPLLLVENAMQSRQAGAAIESFRNEMVKLNTLALDEQRMNGHDLPPPRGPED